MKIQTTLTIFINILFFISFSANSAEVSTEVTACNDAIKKGEAQMALTQAEAILNKNSVDYEGLLCKGRALSLQGYYPEALATMEQAVKSVNDTFSQIITHILIGNLHQTNQQPVAAIASYKRSLAICEKTANNTYKRINHQLIGDVHFKLNDLNEALDSYSISTHLANNDNERTESFERLAKTYHALVNHDKAIEYQLKAVMMQKQAGSLTAYADSSLLLGQYFFDAKEYGHAERNYKKLAEFAKTNGGAYYEAKANFHLAETLFANGDQTAAKALFIDAANLAKKIGDQALVDEIDATQKKLNI